MIVSVVALPVIEILFPLANATVLLTPLATTLALPTTLIILKELPVFCKNTNAVTPISIGSSVINFQDVSAYVLPSVTMTIIPALISPVVLLSLVLVQVPLDPVPATET